jgi:hypothetical protein
MKNDLTGKTIGVFEVLEDSGQRKTGGGGNVLWKVKCKLCGNIRLLSHSHMKRFSSCGCQTHNLLKKALFKGIGEIYCTFWKGYVSSAEQRKLEFSISMEYAWNLFLKQNKKCALSGIDLTFQTRSYSSDGTASLDRIDSTKGYVEGNVQWVHKNINMMKQEYSLENFFKWCKLVTEYNNL